MERELGVAQVRVSTPTLREGNHLHGHTLISCLASIYCVMQGNGKGSENIFARSI